MCLRRRPNEERDVVIIEDDDDDDDDEERNDVDSPFALLAHLVIACSTTKARAPSRPPVRRELEADDVDEEEDFMVEGVEGRAKESRSPR